MQRPAVIPSGGERKRSLCSTDRGDQVPERTEHTPRSAGSNPVRLRFDRFELDEANARLLRDGTPVAVAPTPFGVLCALCRQPGSLLTTNALLDQVWGHQFVTDSVLRTAISELRTALDDDARKPRFIETVSRRGYRFIADTSATVAAPLVATVAPQSRSTESSSFIGRAEALSRLRAQLGPRVHRQTQDRLGCRGTGDRQDDVDRALH